MILSVCYYNKIHRENNIRLYKDCDVINDNTHIFIKHIIKT